MTRGSGTTVSCWMESAQLPAAGRLDRDLVVDVCVIGAGMAGISIAHALTREGRSVAVLDDGEIGSGETGRTTAHLASALDDRFAHLEHLFGEPATRLAYQSHAAAIDRIEQLVADEQIDCGFRRVDGYLFEPPEGDVQRLHKELDAARRAGVAGVRIVGSAPLPFDTGPALHFPRQGQFHPLRYLAGLADSAARSGGQIFTHSRAVEIAGGKDPHVNTEAGHRVSAGQIVVATNTPVNDWVIMHTKQAPYRTYAIAFGIDDDAIPLGLYWDDAEPYHYVRLQPPSRLGEGTLLIVGGEDHKTGQGPGPEHAMQKLENWARKYFPLAGSVAFSWSGQVLEPVDGLGFIGRNPTDEGNVYIVTGDSGHGMTHATIAAVLIPDLIAGRANPWAALYDPKRKTIKSAGTFTHENINVATQYRDYVTSGEVSSVDQVAPDTGATMRDGLKKIAVYRDAAGNVHRLSAICPHLQCMVRWNNLEKSWDCPCHGSRFTARGEVLNGPATSGLPPLE